MRRPELWLALATIAGLLVMLLRDGALDLLGFALATAPLAYGALAWWRGRSRSAPGK